MSDFTPINTQEEFDKAIQERLSREKAKYADYDDLKAKAEKWKDYDDISRQLGTVNEALATNQATLDKLQAESKEKDEKIAKYESEALRTRVALSKKLPYEMHKYLRGSTEEELNSSADELIKFGGAMFGGDPSGHYDDDPPKNKKDQAMRQMLKQINGGKE